MRREHIKMGYMDIPKNYFELDAEEKNVVKNSILEAMLYVLEKNVSRKTDKRKVLLEIIESSIIVNEIEENYECAGVLLDIRNMLNG